jgi:hypothetical protein
VGHSVTQFSDVRPFRLRKGLCTCPNGCSTSGIADPCLGSRREAIGKRCNNRFRGPRLLRSYALTVAQVSVKNPLLLGMCVTLYSFAVRPPVLRAIGICLMPHAQGRVRFNVFQYYFSIYVWLVCLFIEVRRERRRVDRLTRFLVVRRVVSSAEGC